MHHSAHGHYLAILVDHIMFSNVFLSLLRKHSYQEVTVNGQKAKKWVNPHKSEASHVFSASADVTPHLSCPRLCTRGGQETGVLQRHSQILSSLS